MFSLFHGCQSLLSFLISFWDKNWDGTTGVVQFKKRSRLVCFETSLSKTNMIFSKRRKGYKERDFALALSSKQRNKWRETNRKERKGGICWERKREIEGIFFFLFGVERKWQKPVYETRITMLRRLDKLMKNVTKILNHFPLSKKSKTPKIPNSIRFRIAGKAGLRQDSRSKVESQREYLCPKKARIFFFKKIATHQFHNNLKQP